MAHELHDDGFHEIQLSGKQLVFLFMATTVVSIVIFLCGVLVGRGTPLGTQGNVIDGDDLQANASLDPGLDETPAAPQSNTPTSVEGLSYPERLNREGQRAEPVTPAPPPAPAPVMPGTAPAAVAVPPPSPAKAAETTPATAAPAPSAASPAASGGFTVQVTALKAKADADAIAERLQSRGYRAYVVAPEAGGQVIYKVRVGMNMQRPEAEQIMTRLKTEEKFQPLDYALALASGLLLALAFPKFGAAPVAWVALVPLLLAIVRQQPNATWARRRPHPALLGLTTGGVWFVGTLYWTADVLAVFGGLNAVLSWLLCALLVAYMAIYPAAFAWATARVVACLGSRALALAPFVWVSTEWVRGTLFSGFPWVLLGYSQSGVAPVIQTASLVSVHGVSALIVFVGVAAVWLWQDGWRRAWRSAALCLAGVGACVGWGAYRVADGSLTSTGTVVRIGIVQGNVPQDQKWDPARRDDILGRYLRMTREVAAEGATVVLWPESSTPFFFGRDQARTDAVRAAVYEAGIHLVVGSDDVAPEGAPYYNAAFMLDPQGTTTGVYHKMQLVPFGEYIPMRRLLFFAQPLVEGVADFAPGEAMTLLSVGDRRLSVAVCYEVVFPWHGLLAARTGSELLTTITNDAWYGTTSAPHQHFEQARVRAVETGRYLVRAANTGISAIVDPYGRVVARSDLFETTTLVGDVRWQRAPTVYMRIGDSFVFACLAITALALGMTFRRKV